MIILSPYLTYSTYSAYFPIPQPSRHRDLPAALKK